MKYLKRKKTIHSYTTLPNLKYFFLLIKQGHLYDFSVGNEVIYTISSKPFSPYFFIYTIYLYKTVHRFYYFDFKTNLLLS